MTEKAVRKGCMSLWLAKNPNELAGFFYYFSSSLFK